MKFIATILAFSSFVASAHATDCAPGLRSAYAHNIERFRVGELTTADVALAESDYKLKLYSCAATTDVESRLILCSEARNAAYLALKGIEAEFNVGSRSQTDVSFARQRVEDTERTCATRP